MCHGNSKIIFEENILSDKISILKSHKYFTTLKFEDQTNFITEETHSQFDNTVRSILDDLDIDYSNKTIEYWFQSHKSGSELMPHCDFNHLYRDRVIQNPQDYFDNHSEKFISPITIALYLEISDDLVGGDLYISDKTWLDLGFCTNVFQLLNYSYEIYKPKEGNVIGFHGSMYYHWIDKVMSGTRKSMLINLWPQDLTK